MVIVARGIALEALQALALEPWAAKQYAGSCGGRSMSSITTIWRSGRPP